MTSYKGKIVRVCFSNNSGCEYEKPDEVIGKVTSSHTSQSIRDSSRIRVVTADGVKYIGINDFRVAEVIPTDKRIVSSWTREEDARLWWSEKPNNTPCKGVFK